MLNGREARICAETLGRVRQAISDVAFQPNQLARCLKTGRMATISLLVASIADPLFGQLARWVEETVNAQGYGVLPYNPQRSS